MLQSGLRVEQQALCQVFLSDMPSVRRQRQVNLPLSILQRVSQGTRPRNRLQALHEVQRLCKYGRRARLHPSVVAGQLPDLPRDHVSIHPTPASSQVRPRHAPELLHNIRRLGQLHLSAVQEVRRRHVGIFRAPGRGRSDATHAVAIRKPKQQHLLPGESSSLFARLGSRYRNSSSC